MPTINLTQSEADKLVAMAKFRTSDEEVDLPDFGGKVSVPLLSEDHHETFLLDVSRGRIDLRKGTHQNRARQVVILVRLDFGGPPHRNPDGEEVLCPHLHEYREGYGDKWAVPVPIDRFPNLSDQWQTLSDFCTYCHIVRPPLFRRGLFT